MLRTLLSSHHPLRLAWHRTKALAAAMRYGFPAQNLTVIGITGTDGKTTTVGMVAHILRSTGVKVGALSTAFFRVNNLVEWNATQKTSPSPFTIQKFLRRLVTESCTHAVIEYSSHGLVQGRTLFTWPAVAAITNTSREHLDYHGTMEQYRKDKGKLFQMLQGRGTKVLNRDDATYEIYKGIPSGKIISYSSTSPSPLPSPPPSLKLQRAGAGRGGSETYLWLSDIHGTSTGSSAILHCSSYNLPPTTCHLALNISGAFNLENALCAIACAEALGIPPQQSLEALNTFLGIPGRMERIDEGQPFTVFIDFTVTPAAYKKTLATLREQLSTGRLLVLTGSCGDRMREKRPEIGKIVSEYADITVVANEDPYTEDPEKIIAEVWAGIDPSKTHAHRIPDRREAICFLLQKAETGDIVLLCGKGSDTTMWMKEGQVPWNEGEIVRELLRNRTGQPRSPAPPARLDSK